MGRDLRTVLAVLGIVVIGLLTTTAGAATYAVSIDDGIDTPNRTVDVEGNSFTVRGIAEVETGETITATVTRPAGMGYRVYIYGTRDGSRTTIDQKYQSSGDSVSFDTSRYPGLYTPGTYTVALYADGDYRAVYPFVVPGATLSLDAPATVDAGDELTVTATASATDSDVSLTGVRFVLQGDGVTEHATDEGGDGSYSVTFETGELDAGDYTVYAAAQNDSQTPNGRQEVVAISTQQNVDVRSSTSSGTGSGGGAGSGGGSGGGAGTGGSSTGGSAGSTTSQPTTETPADTATPASPTDSTSPAATTSARTPTPAQSTESPSEQETTGSNVLPPNSSTPTQTTSTTMPGFGAVAAVLSLLFVGYRWRP